MQSCTIIRLYSFLIFCSISTTLSAETSHPLLGWGNADTNSFPILSLDQEEKIKSNQGSLLAGDSFVLPANFPDEKGVTTGGLIVKNTKNGSSLRINLGEIARGLAWDKEKDQIYARMKKELVVLQNGSFEIKKKIPFAATGVAWGQIGFFQGKLFGIQGNTFTFYDAQTGEELEQKELPLSKISFSYICSDKEILVWQSKDGANLHAYDPSLNTLKTSYTAHIDSKDAGKIVCGNGGLAVLSPESEIYQTLIPIAKDYYLGKPENQILKENLSYRFTPTRDSIRFILKITPKENSPETELAVAIPPQETSSQVLSEEIFHPDGRLTYDKQNNRTLLVSVPALISGQVWEETVYSAKLTRYNIDSGISRFKTSWEDWKTPNEWKQFLEDGTFYKINDPEIVRIREELKSKSSTVETYVQAVYQHIVKNMVYKQDGKFDPAPIVLQNGHGSCTEHSYAQISLLRSAGIPARMAWNWLPVGEKVELNHKIAEVWHPSFGWIPMEPLASPRSRAGLTFAKHIIFAVLNQPYHSIIKGGDTLANFTKSSGGASRSLSIELKPEISHRNTELDRSGAQEIYPKTNPIKNRILEKQEERTVE